MPTTVTDVLSNWYYFFENLQFSSQDFYKRVEDTVKQRQVPNVQISKVIYKEKAGIIAGLFSSGREYLRVEWDTYIFDICAAPFGTGFFVSWWLGTSTRLSEKLFSKVPGIGGIISRSANATTYYQIDITNMFKECVRQSILDAIDEITKTKGLRPLTELERKAVDQ